MFVGMAGTAAASGFAVTIYEWHVSGRLKFDDTDFCNCLYYLV